MFPFPFAAGLDSFPWWFPYPCLHQSERRCHVNGRRLPGKLDICPLLSLGAAERVDLLHGRAEHLLDGLLDLLLGGMVVDGEDELVLRLDEPDGLFRRYRVPDDAVLVHGGHANSFSLVSASMAALLQIVARPGFAPGASISALRFLTSTTSTPGMFFAASAILSFFEMTMSGPFLRE